jgi:WD40 repeat protein
MRRLCLRGSCTAYSISTTALLVEEESQSQKLALYDLSDFQERSTFEFESPVIYSDFSGDGKRLLVVTADQTIYLLNTTVSGANSKIDTR